MASTEASAPTAPLLSVRELSAEIHLSPSAIYDLAARGKIPHYRIGGSIRFSLAEVIAASRQEVADGLTS